MRCTPLRSNPSVRRAATRLRALLAVGLGVGLGSCGSGETGSGDDAVVARAFDKTLGVADLASRIPDDALPEDSIAMAQRIIDTWIREQVLVHQAINSLPEDLQNFDAEIETYRRHTQFLHRARQRVHHLVLHRAAVERMRVADHADGRRHDARRRVLDAGL